MQIAVQPARRIRPVGASDGFRPAGADARRVDRAIERRDPFGDGRRALPQGYSADRICGRVSRCRAVERGDEPAEARRGGVGVARWQEGGGGAR